MIANGLEEWKIYVCPGSHRHVRYVKKAKCVSLRTLKMEPFVTPSFSVVVGTDYVQHAGTECLVHYNLHHHVYFVLSEIKLPDAIKFNYSGSLTISS